MNCLADGMVKTEDGGFTLLEVLLAVMILGMAYLAIMQNFSVSLRNIERLERHGEQLFAAQLAMEKHFLAGNIDDEVAGEVFAEGGQYVLILVTDEESAKLTTLSLKEL